MEDEALDPGEIVEGLREQVKPVGAEQASAIRLLNPPTALALIIRVVEPPAITVALEAERFSEKFGPLTAAAGTRLANTAVVLPPEGKLGWLEPPAVRYRVPGSPAGPPPPNAISHRPGFNSTLLEESESWPRNFPVVSNALMVPSRKLRTRIALGNSPNVAGADTPPKVSLSF